LICVENNFDNPCFNHGVEEYFLHNSQEDIFILWINKPTILIGRNQNAFAEINQHFVKKHNIEVVRRLSGGGAIYNDENIIQFTFITKRNQGSIKESFTTFVTPIIEALQSLGIDARFSGRNDIVINDKKVSGNAQYYTKDKILHHGSILFDGDLSVLSRALNPRKIKFIDKTVSSVRSRVANIKEFLLEPMDVYEFKSYLENYICKTYKIEDKYELTSDDIQAIKEIADNRYNSKEWNFGKNERYSIKHEVKFPDCGVIEYNLNIENNIITNLSLFGDYFSYKNIQSIEELFIGINYDRESIEKVLEPYDLSDYIKNLEKKDFISEMLSIAN